jgi:hypothetical protein
MAEPTSITDELFVLLGDTQETATVTLFLQLLRESPSLRQWLRTSYFHPQARRRLNACLDNTIDIPSHARTGRQILGWLADADEPRLREVAHLQSRVGSVESRLHGGLTRAQVVQLIRRYQAGSIDLAPFLLAFAWRHLPENLSPSAALYLISARLCQESFSENGAGLIQQLAKAAEYFRGQPVGSITRGHFGYVNWWKLSVLHYMLNHPKPRYCTRDFVRHLATQKISVDTKDLRRFCQKHGIIRDTRPGRPKS